MTKDELMEQFSWDIRKVGYIPSDDGVKELLWKVYEKAYHEGFDDGFDQGYDDSRYA